MNKLICLIVVAVIIQSIFLDIADGNRTVSLSPIQQQNNHENVNKSKFRQRRACMVKNGRSFCNKSPRRMIGRDGNFACVG